MVILDVPPLDDEQEFAWALGMVLVLQPRVLGERLPGLWSVCEQPTCKNSLVLELSVEAYSPQARSEPRTIRDFPLLI